MLDKCEFHICDIFRNVRETGSKMIRLPTTQLVSTVSKTLLLRIHTVTVMTWHFYSCRHRMETTPKSFFPFSNPDDIVS